ncbi:hypothetical protein B0H12DRAFT_1084973 [Mycena haematopus]|nr:hypothetical protein B0H12DRAFT_1084973 [Mycena haematopus]
MSNIWIPKRTLAEVDAILCAPGQSPGDLFVLETCVVDGRVQRVYKNQWPSVREFWLGVSKLYAERPYLVFENQRYTYNEVFVRSLRSAAIFRDVYGVKKGDRVGICSRNYPEYAISFGPAVNLLGAIAVLINAWLPMTPLIHCLNLTECKLIILDSERAERLEPEIKNLMKASRATGVVVLESHEGKGHWKGMQPWETVVKNYKGDPSKVLQNDPKIEHEDDCLIVFTSGTTGLPKGVLSTQRQFLTNTINTIVASRRALLRRGEDIPAPTPDDPQAGILIAVPLFHVTMSATLGGGKVAFLRKWNPTEAARLIRQEKLTTTGGVPSMSIDLIESELKGYPLVMMSHGGASAAAALTTRARAVFPNTMFGLATPVNDLLIVKDGKIMPPGEIGEIWIRGPNVMKGYWRDQAATDKVITKDGWLMSGDIGLLDEEGFLYIRDRIKDIIIRGGENIDSTTVENALFMQGVMEAAAVAVPDEKLGELVAAVVSVHAKYRTKITEKALIALARTRLPAYAVPVMVVFQSELPHNPSGKILKGDLRALARREWEKRGRRAVAKL